MREFRTGTRRLTGHIEPMSRACSVCTHQQRDSIERALTTAQPVLRIAKDFGVAESSLRRHRENHLAPALARALARSEDLSAEKLVSWAVGLHERTLLALVRVETERDWAAHRAYVREARENLDLLGRLRGLLSGGATINVDARQQTVALGKLSDDDLRELAAAAREGRLSLPGSVEDAVDGEAVEVE